MTTYPPTPRSAEALAFIRAYAETHDGLSPSFEEIGEGIGVASKHSVSRLLKHLEERGHIRRLKHRARSIELVARPAKPAPVSGPSFAGLGPFAEGLDDREREHRANALADRLARMGVAQAITACRWLRTYAVDPRALEGCLQALHELPSRDLRHALHSLYPPGSVKPPKPVTERRVSA